MRRKHSNWKTTAWGRRRRIGGHGRRAPRWPAIAAGVLLATGLAWAGDAGKGKALYEARCSLCHGAAGKGDGPAGMAMSPPPVNFATAEYWKTVDLERMRGVIKNGKPGTSMVPFGQALNDGDITDLLSYIETFAQR